jgi:branched-chain amino acid transport system ATP-binding protein
MLEVTSLTVDYGKVRAVEGVSFSVAEGSAFGILGANGAGKTTILKAISGLVKPVSGEIRFEGDDLLEHPSYEMPRRGIAHVPEGRGLFPSLTVMDNLLLGAYVRRREERDPGELPAVFELFPWLEERSGQRAGSLSGGQQQMLAIGRALMLRPKLLILDEPSLGLAPVVVAELFDTLESITGVTILLVEQNAAQALELIDAGIVVERGKVAYEGDSDGLRASRYIRDAYLGAGE